MTDEHVLLTDVDARVATLTLHRPERRNALNAPLRRALREAMREVEANEDVDVVILTGSDPAFCAGLDLKEFGSGSSGLRDATLMPEGSDRGPLGTHAKPIIGAINGVAVTGGLELALACDFLIASDRAAFADTHTRVGVMPGWGLTVLLPEAIGVRRARQMSATGNYVDANLAAQWGLVNHVVPHDQLLPTCRTLAAAIASNDQQAVRTLLATYERTTSTTGAEGWRIEAEVHHEWNREHFSDSSSSTRLQAVIDRGRSQVAGNEPSA
jgi:enoyl-CoA hydratase